jgi:hypothetical protein
LPPWQPFGVDEEPNLAVAAQQGGELAARGPVLANRNEVNLRFDLVLDLVMAGLTVAQIMVASAHPPVRTRLRFSAKPFPPGGTVQFDIRAGGRAVSEARLGEQPASVAAMLPSASGWLGSCRVAALVGSCLLVGMVYLGLHSIYGSLAVNTYDEQEPDGGARLPGNAGCPALPRGTLAHCGWRAGRYGREFMNVGRDGFIRQIARRLKVNTN